MLTSAKKTSKGGHLSCSLEKFQQPDKTWQLWYRKNPRGKDSSQWSPCWLTRGSEHCTFPWAPTLQYNSSPRFLTTQSRETANNYFAVRCQFICNTSNWNSSCPHFFFFFFPPGRQAVLESSVHEIIELASIFEVHFSNRLSVWSSFPCHHWQYSH